MKRNPYSCIYTSSYDRGLEHLLKMWPDVKKAVPKAELHIFYGWQLFVRFYSNNPASMAWKERMDELMKTDGVFHHGRLPQPELDKWYQKCGLFTYPTHFGEINCISAMKAQVHGAVPVVINYAALETTVQHGVKVDGDIYESETKERYKEALIKAFDPKWQEEVRKKMMPWAKKKFAWKNVADQWIEDFESDELKDAVDLLLKEDPSVEKYLPVQIQQKRKLKETL
jgi:glycosyltransferase involved in cell wall biosynthesis